MNQLENRTLLADRLMVGPDGAVYAVLTGSRHEPLPNDLSSAAALRLPQGSSDGGLGGGCFAYSAGDPSDDGGVIGGCFGFSAETPRRDGGEGGGCFRYSAEALRRDGGNVPACFRY